MTELRGQGARTGVNLLAIVHDNGVTKDGKSQYIDFQVDARDPRVAKDPNLHLYSEQDGAEGSKRYNNGAPYSMSQMDKIKEAAGPNVRPLLNVENEQIGMVYGVKGNVLQPSADGRKKAVNTKTLAQSEFLVETDTVAAQYDHMREVSATLRAEREAKAAEAPQTEATSEAEVIEAEIVEEDEPTFS